MFKTPNMDAGLEPTPVGIEPPRPTHESRYEMSWAPEARIIIPHARRASQSRSFSRSTPGHQRVVGCDVPSAQHTVRGTGLSLCTPSVTAEFRSLYPVLAFPPSLRVRSQRSREEHGTVRYMWSERLTAQCRGTPWTSCHRTPTDSQRVLGCRGASSASVN